jgi:glycerophosphoryl diester phosphodiesterase
MKKLFISLFLVCMTTCMLTEAQTVRTFAHRGGRFEHDENTLQAFTKAWNGGYHGFETDIRMSKDGVLYICHDNTLDRTTMGTGILEEKLSSELDTLHTKKGNPFFRFDDLIRFLDGKDSLYVEFEMKTTPVEYYPQERLEVYLEKLYQGVSSIRTQGSTLLFTSFDLRGLRWLKEHRPDAELMPIFSSAINDENIAICKELGVTRIACTLDGTSRAAVKKAHKAGLLVSLWPCQSPEDFMLGFYLGNDLMCNDIPFALRNWLNANAPWIDVIY